MLSFKEFTSLYEATTSQKRSPYTLFLYVGKKYDPRKKTLLLIPGGGGNPDSDFTVMASLLKDEFNLLTFTYDENTNTNGIEICKKIAKQIIDLDKENKFINFSILGFSLGTTWGFWIIDQLGSNFKGKFICIDAAAPSALDVKSNISMVMKLNPPRRYYCENFIFYTNMKTKGSYNLPKGTEPDDTQVNQFSYSFKVDEDPRQKDYSQLRSGSDFIFKLQKEYESWRNSKNLVIEFLDKPNKTGKGIHYPSKMNPSGVYLKGKPLDISKYTSDEKTSLKWIKTLIKDNGIEDLSTAWIVRDKHDENDKKDYFITSDQDGVYNFLKNQNEGMVGSFLRDPKNPEMLDSTVKTLIFRAGKVKDGNLNAETLKEDMKKDLPSEDSEIVIVPGVEHSNICQVAARSIVSKVKSFIKKS
jgi:pimeloyl-ACP methyl ester carboxylesterase